MYQRQTYTLHRYEIVAPHVRNDGSPSSYPETLRTALADAGFTGWTEIETTGYWLGKLERGTTFVIYSENLRTLPHDDVHAHSTGAMLGRIGRHVMPDQEAIQVVSYAPSTVRLIEA